MTIQFDSPVPLLNKSLEDVARLPDNLADEAISNYEGVAGAGRVRRRPRLPPEHREGVDDAKGTQGPRRRPAKSGR